MGKKKPSKADEAIQSLYKILRALDDLEETFIPKYDRFNEKAGVARMKRRLKHLKKEIDSASTKKARKELREEYELIYVRSKLLDLSSKTYTQICNLQHDLREWDLLFIDDGKHYDSEWRISDEK